MPVDYNNMTLFDPVRARMQGEQYRSGIEQQQQRNALAQRAAQRDQQGLDLDRERMQMLQDQGAQDQQAVEQEAKTAWIKNAIGIARANPNAIPVLMRQAKARGLMPPEAPDTISPQELDSLAMEYGIAPDRAGSLEIGNFNPGYYTPNSFAQFMQSQNPADLQRYVTPAQDKIVMINGVPTAFDPRSRDIRALSTPETETGSGAAQGSGAGEWSGNRKSKRRSSGGPPARQG